MSKCGSWEYARLALVCLVLSIGFVSGAVSAALAISDAKHPGKVLLLYDLAAERFSLSNHIENHGEASKQQRIPRLTEYVFTGR